MALPRRGVWRSSGRSVGDTVVLQPSGGRSADSEQEAHGGPREVPLQRGRSPGGPWPAHWARLAGEATRRPAVVSKLRGGWLGRSLEDGDCGPVWWASAWVELAAMGSRGGGMGGKGCNEDNLVD
jgi:hypothetical protein